MRVIFIVLLENKPKKQQQQQQQQQQQKQSKTKQNKNLKLKVIKVDRRMYFIMLKIIREVTDSRTAGISNGILHVFIVL